MRFHATLLVLAALASACDDGTSEDIQACLKSEDKETQIAACGRAIESNALSERGKAAAHHNRGTILLDLGEPGQAIEEFNAALRLDQTHAGALNNRGAAYSELGEYDKAAADYYASLQLEPDEQAHANLGQSQFELERYDLAELNLREAIRLNPKLTHTHYWLGRTLYELKRYAEAVESYSVAIELSPNTGRIYGNRAIARLRLSQKPEALADILRTAELGGEPLVRFWQGIFEKNDCYVGVIDGIDDEEFRSSARACVLSSKRAPNR